MFNKLKTNTKQMEMENNKAYFKKDYHSNLVVLRLARLGQVLTV